MRAKDIKVGRWYKTNVGVGECIADATGRFPAAAKFRITEPVPRGVVFVLPRDVVERVER
jgi:hypothetical protein